MKLAIFGNDTDLAVALKDLKIKPTEIHAPKEYSVEEVCKSNKITLKRYEIDWKSIDMPGAVIAENKFGQYNKRAPMVRRDMILANIDSVLLIGDTTDNSYVEKDVNFKIRNGAKIQLIKWPVKATKSAPPQEDFNPDEDVPF